MAPVRIMVFIHSSFCQYLSRIYHGIGSVCDNDAVVPAGSTGIYYPASVMRGHLQTVYHHQGVDLYRNGASTQFEDLLQMGLFKIQLTVDLIILLVKGATGHENGNAFIHPLTFHVKLIKPDESILPVRPKGKTHDQCTIHRQYFLASSGNPPRNRYKSPDKMTT